ncbi:hypothetical protein BX600DRAFT_466439 [Xylariales sp. PMI_506]|nr:hypothetical protein BX600DRAFT_466439 [Xylariales sp. PMI_506]
MATIIDGIPVAMAPPPGYVVDFDNPKRNSVTAAYWLFGVGNLVTILFVAQRVYVRAFVQRHILWEDVCLFVAYVFSIVLQVLIILSFAGGFMGTHTWEMPLSQFEQFLRALYNLPILYNPVQGCAKMALLLVYYKLAPQLWYKCTVFIVMFIVVVSSLCLLFITIFICSPVSSAWDLSISGSCINRPAVYQATAIIGAITDAMVFAVPMPILVKLKIPVRQKIGLGCLFGVGAVTVFTSVMRLVALINSMGETDQSWGGGVVLLWILAETNLSCICGSLPTIRQFSRVVLPKLLGTDSDDGSKPTHGSSLTPSQPPTFGGTGKSRSRYNKYSPFDDANYTMETIVNADIDLRGWSGQLSGDETHSCGWDAHDGASDKAIVLPRVGIMKTRTTIISRASNS